MFEILLQSYRGKRICVACSGGADSVALLHYLRKNAGQYAIVLSALTCEHGIRQESSLADLAFVERLCKEWDIPLRVFRGDVPALARSKKTGLEEAGRIFRYDCFRTVLNEGAADLIATAHHRDDFIETVLFRLIRGTSLGGLEAFPEREGIIRPFLNVTRAQILDYVLENSLPYVTDESNADESFTRNYLRHTVLPSLEQAVNGAGEHLAEFAYRAAQDDRLLQAMAQERVEIGAEECLIPIALPMPLFMRACVYALKHFGVCKDYTEANLREIASLKTLQSGKCVCLPQNLTAVREYDKIVVCRPDAQGPFTGEIAFAAGSFSINGYELEISQSTGAEERPSGIGRTLAVDLDAFPHGCVIRTRREGDVFTPFGGREKTLKKFLTDRKISARRGRLLPLVASGSEILAVCGVEISDRVKTTAQTSRKGSLTLYER